MAKKVKRILFIAKTRLGFTNILMSMLLSLIEMDYYVKEIDVLQHPEIIINPYGFQGGKGPVEIKYEGYVQHEIEAFKPDMIMFAAGGLTFSEETSKRLKQKGIVILGITLSDPDVFNAAKSYAHRFSFHTTNSKFSLNEYRKLGFNNTLYLPFGIDSRFFVPTGITPKYNSDVAIIGHYQPSRFTVTEGLMKRFCTRVYGRRWPLENAVPVAYPEWLHAIQSSKIVVDFPRTRAGFNNVKVRLFEVAAAGTMLVTEYLEEINEFFVFGNEIAGYKDVPEMYDKIEYYLNRPAERERIAKNAQMKCAGKHMWKNRFSSLFKEIGFD